MYTEIIRNNVELHVNQKIATEAGDGYNITSIWDGEVMEEAQKCNTLITRWQGWVFTDVVWNGVKQAVRIVLGTIPTPTVLPIKNPKAA